MTDVQQFITQYLNNPWVVLFGYLLGVVGFFLAIRELYVKRKLKKVVSYAIRTVNVITSKNVIDHLRLTYREEEIASLSITKVLVYSSGKLSITKKDIPELKPIQIESEFPIYHHEVTNLKESSNGIAVIPDGSKKKLTFDFRYLSHEQGAIIKIYHGGKRSSNIKITGAIIDGSIKHIVSVDEVDTKKFVILLNVVALLLIGAMFFAFFKYFFMFFVLAPIVIIFMIVVGHLTPQPLSIPRGYSDFNDES
jgi:hypothetical protein